MKTASGLTLIAIGAVFAFAVNGHPWFLNLQVCGWILMIIGVIGLAVPRRGYGWLRRQVVVRNGPDGRRVMGIRQKRYPPYITINPAAAGIAGLGAGDFADAAEMADGAEIADAAEMPATSDTASPAQASAVPAKETVEEFFQD